MKLGTYITWKMPASFGARGHARQGVLAILMKHPFRRASEILVLAF